MIYLPGDLSTIQAIDKILDPSNIPLALFSILEGKKYRNLSKIASVKNSYKSKISTLYTQTGNVWRQNGETVYHLS